MLKGEIKKMKEQFGEILDDEYNFEYLEGSHSQGHNYSHGHSYGHSHGHSQGNNSYQGSYNNSKGEQQQQYDYYQNDYYNNMNPQFGYQDYGNNGQMQMYPNPNPMQGFNGYCHQPQMGFNQMYDVNSPRPQLNHYQQPNVVQNNGSSKYIPPNIDTTGLSKRQIKRIQSKVKKAMAIAMNTYVKPVKNYNKGAKKQGKQSIN